MGIFEILENNERNHAKKVWPDYPKVEFGANGERHMVFSEAAEIFWDNPVSFFQHCADSGRDPEEYQPVIARWQPCQIDADDIFGAIDDQLPDEDHGSDPIREMAACKLAAEAAQKVLDESDLGSYWPLKKALLIPEDWRIQAGLPSSEIEGGIA